MQKIFYTKNSEETKELAARMVKTWKGGDVIGLTGDLGAGKTTFVQGVAKALGVKRAVRSPTFLRLQVYPVSVIARTPTTVGGRGNLHAARLLPACRQAGAYARNDNLKYFVHIDAYRIKNPEQLLELGLEEYLGRKDTIIIIEWAEKVKKILPRVTQWLQLYHGKREGERRLTQL